MRCFRVLSSLFFRRSFSTFFLPIRPLRTFILPDAKFDADSTFFFFLSSGYTENRTRRKPTTIVVRAATTHDASCKPLLLFQGREKKTYSSLALIEV